jgi:hypothetical protein
MTDRREAMHDHATLTHHGAARLLIGALAVCCLAVPVLAGADDRPEENSEAAKVAKKMGKARSTAHQAEQEREALEHFQEEVASYADLHAKLIARLEAVESVSAQKALARALEATRAKARQGDIFRPEVQPLFRRLIAEQLRGPDTGDAQRTVLEGNPGEGEEHPVAIVVRVNAVYPLGASRSTVPPSVLATLPPLPACLHYRFVDRDLILVDSVAGLIVDVLPAAAPALVTR